MNKLMLIAVTSALSFAACDASNSVPMSKATPNIPTLTQEWVLTGLDAPESIIPTKNSGEYYVSNVNGEAADKNGRGYISIISEDGKFVEQQWVTGLNAPKGMTLVENRLYVSDIDQLIVIDTNAGTIIETVTIDGAGFLNDVESFMGMILVSDSANAKIYSYRDAKVETFLADDRLGGVNGLLSQGDRLKISTMQSGSLLNYELKTTSLSELASGMNNADGIVALGSDNYLVSSWPGKIHYVDPNRQVHTLIDTTSEPVFANDMFADQTGLFVPNWQPGSVTKYKLN